MQSAELLLMTVLLVTLCPETSFSLPHFNGRPPTSFFWEQVGGRPSSPLLGPDASHKREPDDPTSPYKRQEFVPGRRSSANSEAEAEAGAEAGADPKGAHLDFDDMRGRGRGQGQGRRPLRPVRPLDAILHLYNTDEDSASAPELSVRPGSRRESADLDSSASGGVAKWRAQPRTRKNKQPDVLRSPYPFEQMPPQWKLAVIRYLLSMRSRGYNIQEVETGNHQVTVPNEGSTSMDRPILRQQRNLNKNVVCKVAPYRVCYRMGQGGKLMPLGSAQPVNTIRVY